MDNPAHQDNVANEDLLDPPVNQDLLDHREKQDQEVRLGNLELASLVCQESAVPQGSLVLQGMLVNKDRLAQQASQDLRVSAGREDLLVCRENRANVEVTGSLERMDPEVSQAKLDSKDHRDNLDHLDNLDLKEKLDPEGRPDSLERVESPDSEDSLALLDQMGNPDSGASAGLPEHQGRRVNLGPKVRRVRRENEAQRASVEHLDKLVCGVRSAVQST